MLKNLSVATSEHVGYYKLLKQSCAKHDIEFIPLGLGQKWSGFQMKYTLWEKYINTLPDNEIIMINDAYDVVILDKAEIIIQKFKKFNKPIVFSIQKGAIIDMSFPKCYDQVMCSGNIIGYVKQIKQLIKVILKHKNTWKDI